MADDTPQTGDDRIATDHLTELNGAAITQTATSPKVQRVKVGYGPDGSMRDVDGGFPLPVTDAGSDELMGILAQMAGALAGAPDVAGRLRVSVELAAATLSAVTTVTTVTTVSTVTNLAQIGGRLADYDQVQAVNNLSVMAILQGVNVS